ncbi:hypothetical protein [Fundidesulfovibrio putealis]|uniref:hypothetical protein n=1 Tax=Fundidesulfovibrio putealis TaxID=270496 RepID=UPI0012ECA5FA|nr:hypothetical protein [Fundidesulfovibrio putealis]
MRSTCGVLLVVLIIFGHFSVALSVEPLPDGFRGLKWDSTMPIEWHVRSVKENFCIDTGGGVETVKFDNHEVVDRLIFGMDVASIVYSFRFKKLSFVRVYIFSGKSEASSYIAKFVKKFGKPDVNGAHTPSIVDASGDITMESFAYLWSKSDRFIHISYSVSGDKTRCLITTEIGKVNSNQYDGCFPSRGFISSLRSKGYKLEHKGGSDDGL